MNVICSTAGIVNPFRPIQGIMDMVNAGFQYISMELDMCCSSYELEHFGEPKEEEEEREFPPISESPEEINRFFNKMSAACRDRGLNIPVMFAPYLPRDTKRADMAERLVMIQEEAIRYCGSLNCGYMVIRPLPSVKAYGEEWQINRDYYLRLCHTAKACGVMILLENQYVLKNGQAVRGVCADGRRAARWIDRLNEEAGSECFGFCMDVGVCSLCGQDMYEFATALGGRMKAVVLRDCDGYHEGSMLPFTSVCYGQPRTEWLGLIRGLRHTGFDGQLILRMSDTAAVFSPLLRPSLMALGKAVADYFKWQIGIENLLKKYDSIVLFGAGNMCRNYMKCYGDMYPPLFTCDNNEKVWGTEFCGLEVKPPAALQTIPENCGIFICNIYYREIEKQLLDMGITNIEFFNDEYMPSFHFDRLKGV